MKKLYPIIYIALILNSMFIMLTFGQSLTQNLAKLNIYEESSGVHVHSFDVNDQRLFVNINKENRFKNDFSTGTEFYDIYISDSLGNETNTGDCITIDCFFPYKYFNDQVGGNIDAIELVYKDGTQKYATKITNYELGFGLTDKIYIDNAGFINRALYQPDGNSTRMGAYRSSITVGKFETFNEQEFKIDEYTVALWHLNEGSGNIFYDATNNHNDGNLESALWTSNGLFGNALEFKVDGTSYSKVPVSSSLQNFNQCTIEMWFKLDEKAIDYGYKFVLTRYGTYNPLATLLVTYVNQKDSLVVDGYFFPMKNLRSKAIQPETWYKVALTYDGKTERLFLNDELQDESIENLNLANPDDMIWLGKNGYAAKPHYFRGIIDEIRISNVDRYSSPIFKAQKGWNYVGFDLEDNYFYPFPTSIATNNNLNIKFKISDDVVGDFAKGGICILTGDVNGDKLLEIVYVKNDHLKIINKDGMTVLDKTLPQGNCAISSLIDIDEDGILDIGIGSENIDDPEIYFFDANGTLLKQYTQQTPAAASIYPKVFINGKIISSKTGWYYGGSDPNRGVVCFDNLNGNILWYFDMGLIGFRNSRVSIADIDNDDVLEFTEPVYTSHNGAVGHNINDGELRLVVLNENGELELNQVYDYPNDGSAFHRFVDFYNTNSYKIIGFEGHDPTYYHGKSQIHVFNLSGIIENTFDGKDDADWRAVTCDINHDGVKEIIATNGNKYFTNQVILDNSLNLLKQSAISGWIAFGNDLNGDGEIEFGLTSSDTLKILSNNLGLIAQKKVSGEIKQAIISDIDGNGINEILIVSEDSLYSFEFGSDLTTINHSLQGPKRFNLAPNYPNPFNPTTTIQYSLPKTGNVTLNIYNSRGQKIKTLINANQSPGNYWVTWDGTNDYGQPVSSGVYYYQIRFNDKIESKKMILIR